MTVTKNENMEDTVPVSEEQELTPKEKEKQQAMIAEMSKSFAMQRFRTSLQDIAEYMSNKGITLEQLRQEVDDKKCDLTKSRRDFVQAFKVDFIQDLLDRMYKKRSEVKQLTYND